MASLHLAQLPDSAANAGYQIAVTAIGAIVVWLFPRLRTPRRLLAVGVLVSAFLFRGAFPAYVLLCATLYVVATRLSTANTLPSTRWRRCVAAILVVIAVFIAGRAWQAQRYGTQWLGVPWALYYLDMWTLLRLVSFLWEVGSGRARSPAPLTYALWCALPFTAFGPLLRFSEFDAQLSRLQAPEATAGVGDATWWRRIVLALAQLVLGTFVAFAMPWSNEGGFARRLVQVFVLAPWGFYLLSAATFTLMECLGRTWGLLLPRSFDRAFGRANLSDFWAHWNMSATAIFRDYLFYNRWGRRTVNVYVNVVVLFFLVGLWHGATPYWLLWGTLHGVGFAAYLYYRKWRTTPRGQRVFAIPRPVAIAVTYLFVCACWAIPSQIIKLVTRFT